jgi:hypothetical protein
MIDFMGLFFVVFSFFKFLDYKGFPSAFAQYDPLSQEKCFVCKNLPLYRDFFGLDVIVAMAVEFCLYRHHCNIIHYHCGGDLCPIGQKQNQLRLFGNCLEVAHDRSDFDRECNHACDGCCHAISPIRIKVLNL